MSIEVISGNEKLVGEKIRYINYNNINYLIYSLKEQDEDGYEKLYMNKITDNEDDIISDFEWEELKSIIPVIVKQIKSNNIVDFDDLSLSQIEKIDLNYSKPFKLKITIVDSIKKEEISELIEEVKIEQIQEQVIEEEIKNEQEELPEQKIEKMEEDLQELIGGISKEANDSVDDLDEFLNNYEEELNKYEEELKKIEVPIRPDIELEENDETEEIELLKQQLDQEIKNNEELTKKVEDLESTLNKYKDKLERIKIMLEA